MAREIKSLAERRQAYGGKRGPNGRRLCRWCGKEVQPPRRTYCSDQCVHEWLLRSSTDYLRRKVWERDHGVCALCGLDTEAVRKELLRLREARWRAQTREERDTADARLLDRLTELALPGASCWYIPHLWEADHIVPVSEGGDSNLENVRTLCWRCHRRVTAELARERAAKRREGTA